MAALKTLPQPPEVCYNKGKGGDGMKVTESRSGARCTLTTGESVVLLRLKEQQKGIWLVEELKLDRTQPETILQEAMQAVGDFLRKQKMQLLLGCRSAQS